MLQNQLSEFPSSDEILDSDFISLYKNKQPEWGFNGLGYIVFLRTYSRRKDDGNLETWPETIERCIRGAQKIGACYTKEEARRLFDYVFNLKCNFAGRSLWQLGTPLVDRFCANSLINCFYTNIEVPEDYCFVFENLMLGGGVTASVRKDHIHQLPKIKNEIKIEHKNTKDADFIVPDSREGWVELLRRTLNSIFITGKDFTYSTILVRGYGEKINGFGGTASGPQILIDGINNIINICNKRSGKRLRSVDALYIFNIIASIVVAGNIRRCLPEDSLIHTKYGLKKIKDINIGDLVQTSTGYYPVLNKFNQGKQKLIRIHTENGFFDCTPNHQMAVLTDTNSYIWKTADSLSSNDRLITNREPIEGQKTYLPKWNYDKPKQSTTCQDIIIPDLDMDLSWFLGLFAADGYVYANKKENGFNAYISLVFDEKQRHIAEKAKKQIEKFGLTNVEIKHRKNENSWLVSCVSKQLAYYFNEHIKQPKTSINIPSFIINANNDIKLAYISGVMDGDGSVNNRPLCICSSVYKNFILQLQKLLYSCGIESSIKLDYTNESRKKWQKNNFLYIKTLRSRNLIKNSGFSLLEIPDKNKSSYSNSFPKEMLKKILSHEQKRKCGFYSLDNLNIDCLEKNLNIEYKFCPVKVLKIEFLNGEFQTYDIEVKDKHEFFCNGYLTHNSAELALGDADDILFLRAKRWDLGNIPNYAAMSNNTIVADNYDYTSTEFWKPYNSDAGECYGLFNLELSQKFGRLIDGPMNKSDLYPSNRDNCEGTNPCSEISLSDGEVCNLSELYLNNISSLEEMIDCAKLLYKTQKAICAMNYLHEKTNKIVHKNMRIGIGITGICQSISKLEWLDSCYKQIRKFDKEWSKFRGWNESIKITTTKPSGTLSLLSGSTPGVHPAFSKYYIRRIRIGATDNTLELCRSLGYHIEPAERFDGSKDETTMVVSIPCKCENAITAEEMTAVEQLELVKKIQTLWADNAVSVTVYFRQEELPDIQNWLKENYQTSLKCVSFLRHQDHGFKQAPYEKISQEQYEKMMNKESFLTKEQWEDLKNIIDTKNNETLDLNECVGGNCPIR